MGAKVEATKDDEVDTIDEALEDIDEDEQAASSEADAIVAMDVQQRQQQY
jgi:hypothetical protein